MRSASKSEIDDVPRYALWLVALVCFAPLTFMWLLGLLYVLLWVAIVAVQLTQPERLGVELSELIWELASPIAQVIAGFIGLVGLVRVLTLSRRERPKSHRIFTIGMVVVGLLTALFFHQPFGERGMPDVQEIVSVAGLVFLVLPFTGAAWLLAKSWRLLLAGPVRTDVEIRRPRIKRERRDDWRLDA
jgi:hypothetical protein